MLIRHKTAGTALIMALFITALAAIVATAILFHLHVVIFQSAMQQSRNQLLREANGILIEVSGSLKPKTTKTLQLPQIIKLPINKRGKLTNGDLFSWSLTSANNLFNLNALQTSVMQPYFARLLMTLNSAISQQEATQLATNVTAWQTNQGNQDYYLKQRPPYVASQQPMVDKSELRLVQGFNQKIYNEIVDYVTALPVSFMKMDVNALIPANIPVLQAMNPGLSKSVAADIVSCVQAAPAFITLAAFNQACLAGGGTQKNLQQVQVGSQFLWLTIQVSQGQVHVVEHLLLTWRMVLGQVRVVVLSRTIN